MTPTRQSTIVVYPGYGFATRQGEVAIRIAGVVYEHRHPLGLRKQFLVNMLARAMKATPAESDDELFRQRVAPFVAKAKRGERIWVQVGHRRFRLRRRTRRSGWFRGRIRIPTALLEQLKGSGEMVGDRLPIQAWLASNPDVISASNAFVLPEQGISIVSDIDDTIKESNVANRRELLINTFLREYRCIDGMGELYRSWAARGAAFHYVSSSPWQLFDPLHEWRSNDGFPPGTLHLRTFRLRDQVIRRKANAKRRKSRSIGKMFKDFPRRRFVLIGDSGERDPEIYAKMCGKYRDRIAGIFIRDLARQPLGVNRFRKVQSLASPTICETFASPEELGKLVSRVF